MKAKALQGVRIVECASFVSGPYCGKVLADSGAEVIKIEDPLDDGDVSRRIGPFPNDVPHRERSALFLYLNTNKKGTTLDLRTKAGVEIFRKLITHCDILIENHPPDFLSTLGLDYDSLRKINSSLVMTSITPFGQTGPYKDYKCYYLNTFHAGGEGYLLPPADSTASFDPNKPPIKIGGFVGEYDIGITAAIATLACLFLARQTGEGQHIDVSAQEALLSLNRQDLSEYNFGIIHRRAMRAPSIGGLFPCKDGFVEIMPREEKMWSALVKAMGDPSWAKEGRYKWEIISDRFGHQNERREANARIVEWTMKQAKKEICKACEEHDCPVAASATMEDLINSEHLNTREFFAEVKHPEVGRLKYPASPWKLPQTPHCIRSPAPMLGQHNEEVYCNLLGYTKDDLVQLHGAGVI